MRIAGGAGHEGAGALQPRGHSSPCSEGYLAGMSRFGWGMGFRKTGHNFCLLEVWYQLGRWGTARRAPPPSVRLSVCSANQDNCQHFLPDPFDKAVYLPMSSPETMSSTRRLRCRPAAVSFVATGCDLPNPLAEGEFVPEIPCWMR